MTEAAILEAAFGTVSGDGRVTASDQATTERPAPTPSARARQLVQRFGIGVPFAITFIVLSLISPPFLRSQNLTNILDQQAGIIIVACAGARSC